MKEELTKEERTRRSLKNSVIDGAFFSVKLGLADSFFSAFAVFLRATTMELGLLGSLPLAISSAFQLLSTRLIHLFKSRIRLIIVMAWLHSFSLLGMVVAFALGRLTMPLMILFIVMYWCFDRISATVWNSLMGDIVPEETRGRYFGNRNRAVQVAMFLGVSLGGGVLAFFEHDSRAGMGFIVIFTIAFIARVISIYFLGKMFEPEHATQSKPLFTILEFLRLSGKTNFGNLVLYYMFMMSVVYMTAPFFAAYALKDVGMSLWEYTLMLGASVVVQFFTLPLWGKASDRYGSRKILVLAGFIMPLVPFLCAISRNATALILANAFSGFAWGGFDLAVTNYLFDSTSSQKRATCVMYHTFFNGIGIIVGSMLGALIAKHNTLFWSSYVLVFLISGALRFVVSIVFLPRLKEIRNVEHISYNRLLFDVLPAGHIAGKMVIPMNQKRKKH